VSLEGRTDSFAQETSLALPLPDGVFFEGTGQLTVHVRIDEELVTRKLPGQAVVVQGEGDLARWKTQPAQVEVTLTGALLAVEKARASLVPTAKLAADGKPREAEVTIEGLPPGIGVKISPERVKLVAVRPPAPRAP
jgi:hypothetical protein